MAEIEMWDTGWKEMLVEIEAETIKGAMAGVKDAGDYLRTQIVRKIKGGRRTGKRYRRRKDTKRKGAFHRASAPGEPPKSDSGHLAKYMAHEGPVFVNGEVVSRVGVDLSVVPYARRLELGGFHIAANGRAVYIEKRPYLRTTFEEQREEMMNRILKQVNP